MIIFDIFTFKKEATKIFSIENFSHILETARYAIIEQAKDKVAKGNKKKFIVDEKVISKIKILKDSCKNDLVSWILDLLIKAVPTITQFIYNSLKEKIENL